MTVSVFKSYIGQGFWISVLRLVLTIDYWGRHCRIKHWRMLRFNIFIIYDSCTSFYFSKRRLVPVGCRCKLLLARFLALIFLLSIMSLSSWRRWLVSWFTVNAAFPSSVRKVGVEITTLHLGRLSVIKDLSVRRLSNIFRDVKR